jgi:hypothetical protein
MNARSLVDLRTGHRRGDRSGRPAPPVELTAEQDHKLMMDKLGLGASARERTGAIHCA